MWDDVARHFVTKYKSAKGDKNCHGLGNSVIVLRWMGFIEERAHDFAQVGRGDGP